MDRNFEYVRRVYGVAAEIGRVVMYGPERGVIAQDRGAYVGVLLDKHKPSHILPFHPKEITYTDEIEPVRPMTPSQKRYQRFLDADCGMTFGEWLRTPWAKEPA